MGKHWAEDYVGLSYKEYDCAQLCMKVNRERFGKDIHIPEERPPGIRGVSSMIDDLQGDFAERVEDPVEGDAVLMIGRGRINHIGTYCLVNGEPHVLHAMKNVGMTCLHRMHALKYTGLDIEGFYRWK